MNKCASLEEEFIQNGRLENSMSSSQEIDRYKKLLVIFKTLFTTFREHINKPLSFQHMILIEHPQFMLDTIFYNTEHITEENKWFSQIRSMLEKYEYMAYSIINKCEEYEFDLSTFPNNFTQISEYCIHLCKGNFLNAK
jgi:DNA polymerase III delta prime subunit